MTEQQNDYREAYKPFEGTPPPKRFRGSLNVAEMVERLTPANARSVLAFLNAQGCNNVLPEKILQRLIEKSNEATG